MNTEKQIIPTANRKRTNKDYDFDHITTTDYMQPLPVMMREVVPNMELSINCDSFVRLNPMVKPTFGRAKVNQRLFFVPMRVLMPRWNEFLASEPIYSLVDGQYGLQTYTPLVRNNDFLKLFESYCSAGTSSDYDLAIYDESTSSINYFKHTDFTLYAYSVLLSLGYKLNWYKRTTDATSESDSALPLLAYAKVMLDWYYPSQYINSSVVQQITPYLQSDSLAARYVPEAIIYYIFFACRFCAYDDSLLVNAWDNPVAPNNGVESIYSIPDITYNSLDAGVGSNGIQALKIDNEASNGTPLTKGEISGSGSYAPKQGISISQYQHDVLKALTDYTTRHRLSGVRAVDRLLSEYGVNLSSEIMKRSLLLSSESYNIQFGDVMAHSDTMDSNNNTGALLGDYAGKGIGYSNETFAYKVGNEFGYLLVINSIIPHVGYYQGKNRLVKHKSILDFWHADFDGLGVQAIAADEVYNTETYNSLINVPQLHSRVFGFVPRYAEYKTAPSVMSGLFAVKGNTDIKSFSLMRDLSAQFASGVSSITHDVSFVQGNDSRQFNRIFYAYDSKTGGINQNFILINHFTINQTDETSPLYDTYDFKEVQRAVEMHTQASKVN